MKQKILLEIDLEKPVPDFLAHIENRASTISGVRLAEGRVVVVGDSPKTSSLPMAPVRALWYRRLLGLS